MENEHIYEAAPEAEEPKQEEAPKNNHWNPKYLHHIIDMDSDDKKLITIPNRTLVKFKDIFFYFAGGHVYHSHDGFNVFIKGKKGYFEHGFGDKARDEAFRKNLYGDLYYPKEMAEARYDVWRHDNAKNQKKAEN